MNEQKMQECLEYFRREKIWSRLLKGFKEKYRSYGKFSGSVSLRNLNTDDIEELEGFFGKNFHGQKSVQISAEKFKKALQDSRYKEITPEELLEKFLGEPLIGKHEEELLLERDIKVIEERFLQVYDETPAKEWLETLKALLGKAKKETLKEWEQMLKLSAEIVNHFPYRSRKNLYLAVFAASLTGNPHTFDQGTTESTLLYKLIEKDLEQRGITIKNTTLFPAYKKQRSYLAAGVLIDDISNYALLYGVQAMKKTGKLHTGMEGFYKEGDIVQVPLAVLTKWEEIRCPQQEIYIVENPSVFAMLCGECMEKKSAYMCMNGQPRLAGLMVLDLLAKSGVKVFYAGDLDPEGLLIAQKLAQYYPGTFSYWQMSVESYKKCKSGERLSDKRLKMLEQITDERLLPVAQEIKKYKAAGYQERLEWI